MITGIKHTNVTTIAAKLIFKEYSKKFMAPDYAFHLINDKDSAERFLINILEPFEREKKAKQEKLEPEKQEKLEREKIIKEAYLKLSQTQRMDLIHVLNNNVYYRGPVNSDWNINLQRFIKNFFYAASIADYGYSKDFDTLKANDVDELLLKISNHEKADRAEFAKKLKAHELMLTDKNRIGFRDFYIGMDTDIYTYLKNGATKVKNITFKNEDGKKCNWSSTKPPGDMCYGLDYRFSFGARKKLFKIRVYVLNYVQSSSYIGNLFNMGTSEDPVVNLINSLNKKYKKSYSYSENERLLFNDGETDELYIAYEDGQVIFSLERVDDGSYDTDIYAYITYRNKSDGLKFLDAIKPKTATSDF